MNGRTVYLIIVSCIALQSIVRDLVKLISKLKERSGHEERAAKLKRRAAGDYTDDE